MGLPFMTAAAYLHAVGGLEKQNIIGAMGGVTAGTLPFLDRLAQFIVFGIFNGQPLQFDRVGVALAANGCRIAPQQLFFPGGMRVVAGNTAVITEHGPVDALFSSLLIDPAFVTLAA